MLVTRQHPFVLIHAVLVATFLLFIPVLAVSLVGTGWFVTASFAFAVLAVLKLWLAWYGWNRTLLLVTNERVMFLAQRGLLQRDLVECPLKGIQQVAHRVSGVLHTVAGYGDLDLSTNSSQKPITVPNVPDPYVIQQEIVRAQNGEGLLEDEAAA